jgi:hypothetical protein
VVAVGSYASTNTISDGTNIFTALDGSSFAGSSGDYQNWVKISATGGSLTETVTAHGPTNTCTVVNIFEIQNVSAVDSHLDATGPFSAVTTTQAQDLILGTSNENNTSHTVTAGPGWSVVVPSTNNASTTTMTVGQLESAIGTYTPIINTAAGVGGWFTVAFKATSFGGGGAAPVFVPFPFFALTLAAFPGLAGQTPASTSGDTQVDLHVGSPIQAVNKTTAYAGNDAASTLYTCPAGAPCDLHCWVYTSCHTTVATATIIPALLFTDEQTTAETLNGSTATCTTAGSGDVSSQSWPIRANASSTIYFKTTIANSPHYDSHAVCELAGTQ